MTITNTLLGIYCPNMPCCNLMANYTDGSTLRRLRSLCNPSPNSESLMEFGSEYPLRRKEGQRTGAHEGVGYVFSVRYSQYTTTRNPTTT